MMRVCKAYRTNGTRLIAARSWWLKPDNRAITGIWLNTAYKSGFEGLGLYTGALELRY